MTKSTERDKREDKFSIIPTRIFNRVQKKSPKKANRNCNRYMNHYDLQ